MGLTQTRRRLRLRCGLNLAARPWKGVSRSQSLHGSPGLLAVRGGSPRRTGGRSLAAPTALACLQQASLQLFPPPPLRLHRLPGVRLQRQACCSEGVARDWWDGWQWKRRPRVLAALPLLPFHPAAAAPAPVPALAPAPAPAPAAGFPGVLAASPLLPPLPLLPVAGWGSVRMPAKCGVPRCPPYPGTGTQGRRAAIGHSKCRWTGLPMQRAVTANIHCHQRTLTSYILILNWFILMVLFVMCMPGVVLTCTSP